MKKILVAFFVLLYVVVFSQTPQGNNRGGSNVDGKFYASKYGCIGDGAIALGNSTAGSANIKIVGAAFLTNNPVGKKFRVQGAGTSNVDQTFTCSSVLNDSVAVMGTNAVSTKTLTTIDYGTDNTTPLQNLLQLVVASNGGKIFIGRGLYLFFGALQTSVNSVNPNCQVYIPLTNATSKAICQLEIEGEYANQILFPIISSGFGNVSQNCTILKSEIDGSGTLPSLIGTPWYVPSYSGANYNFTSVNIKNIVIETKSQVNNVDVAGTMCGINANYINQFSITNYAIGTESIMYNQANPTNLTYGIIFPYFLNNGVSHAGFGIYIGYHWGAKISDHFYGEQFTALFDTYALEYNNGEPGNASYVGHSATIESLQTELCPFGINITGESSLLVSSWRGERDHSGGWYHTTGNDVDFTGAGVSGTVYVQQMDMTNVGIPDYTITSNDYNRFKLKYNNNLDVDNSMCALTDGATIDWNTIKSKKASVTLGGDRILSITGYSIGQRIDLEVTQDATGSRTLTPPSNSVSNTGSFIINPYPLSSTLINGLYDGTNWIWQLNNLTALSTTPATAFIAALSLAGYTPGGTESAGYSSFYANAVTHGYWSKLKVFYTFSGTTATTQGLNFVNPSNFVMNWQGTVTHNSSGMSGDGTTGYGNTGFNPSANISSSASASFGLWTTTSATPTFATAGVYTGTGNTPDMQIFFNYDGAHSGASISGVNDFVSVNNPGSYTGLFIADRTATTLLTFYQGTTSLGTSTSSSGGTLPNAPIYIGARNAGSGPGNYSAQTYIFCFAGDGLTSTDITNIDSDLSALKTAMGR